MNKSLEKINIVKKHLEEYLSNLKTTKCDLDFNNLNCNNHIYKELKLKINEVETSINSIESIKHDLEILVIFKTNISYEVYECSSKIIDQENDYVYYENQLNDYICIEIHNVEDFNKIYAWHENKKKKEEVK